MIFLSELLSTIGMVLLAGEFVQGKRRWFNKALERILQKLFPNALVVGYIRVQRSKYRSIKALFRGSSDAVVALIIGPIFLLVFSTFFLIDIRNDFRIKYDAALDDMRSDDAAVSQRGFEFDTAAKRSVACGQQIDKFLKSAEVKAAIHAGKTFETPEPIKNCRAESPVPTYDVSYWRSVKLVVTYEPTLAIRAAMVFVFQIIIVLIFWRWDFRCHAYTRARTIWNHFSFRSVFPSLQSVKS
jgi:hypothetical protein